MSKHLVEVTDVLPKKHGPGNRRDWETRLVDAIFLGDMNAVKHCIHEIKTDVNFHDARGWTALHSVSDRLHNRSFYDNRPHRQIMNLLLQGPRAKPTIRTWRGESPLDFAERRGFDSTAEIVRKEAEAFEARDLKRIMGKPQSMRHTMRH